MIRLVLPRELRAHREDWEAFHEVLAHRTVFSTLPWLERYLHAFSDGHVIILHYGKTGIEAAAILQRRSDVAMHLQHHAYYPELLRTPTASLTPVFRFLATSGARHVSLRERDDTAVQTRVLEGASPYYVVVPRETRPLHIVSTAQTFEAYLASRKGKVRNELRRKAKRFASQLPDVHLEEFRPGEADRAMAIACEIERLSWKQRADTAIVSSEAELRFYRDVLSLDEGGSQGRAYVLMAGGKPRAYVLGIAYRGTFNALKTSYPEEDAALSPGQVLFFHVIRALCDDPEIGRLELLGSDARWKVELSTDAIVMRAIELQARSLHTASVERLRQVVQASQMLQQVMLSTRAGLGAVRRLLGPRVDGRVGRRP